MIGVVETFDEFRGLGEVRDDDGTLVPFQCLAIADGTRTIPVGTKVFYELIPKMGRFEAWQIRPI